MAQKKPKSKQTKPVPVPDNQGQEQPPVPDTGLNTPPDEQAGILPASPPDDPTQELLFLALTAWRFSMISNGVLYKMTRTYAHHRMNERFDTGVIFNEIAHINRGDHKAFLEEIDAFASTVMEEYKASVAPKADKG